MRTSRLTIAALALALPLSLAACGSSDADAGAASSAPMASSAAPSPSESMMADTASMPFGPGCAAVPADGAGSFSGMASDPVATAASNNPLLSTLVTAVGEAGLGETLNTAKDVTVFAPTNDAFAALDKATMDKAMADPEGLLTTVLTNHVVEGRLAPDMLAGDHTDARRHDHHGRGLGRGLHRRRRQGRVRQRADRQRHRLHHRRRPAPRELTAVHDG